MYFEFSIPEKMPSHIIRRPESITAWQTMFDHVSQRMHKLENALRLSGLRGEDFAYAIASAFDKNAEEPAIDKMSVRELAELALLLAKTNPPQPDRYIWPNCEVVVDIAFLTTKEWEMIRSIGLGGSEAAVAMGISHFNTRQHLYHLKIDTPILLKSEDKGLQFILDYGHAVEPLVLSTFCRRAGATVIPETRMFRHKKYPWITANCDGFAMLPPDSEHPEGRVYILEAKTTTNFNKDAWADNKIPPYYVTQCRQYMSVLDDPRICGVYISCIYGNTPDCFVAKKVDRDIPMEEAQIEEINDFWQNYILSHKDPGPSGDPEKDTEIIRQITGPAKANITPKQLPRSITDVISKSFELDAEYHKAQKIADSYKKARDNQYTIVKEAMKDNVYGTATSVSDGMEYRVTWKPTPRTQIDTDLLQSAYPDAYNAVVKVDPEGGGRRFSIKERKV